MITTLAFVAGALVAYYFHDPVGKVIAEVKEFLTAKVQ